MKSISDNLKQLLAEETQNLTRCFKFNLVSGKTLGFTEYSENLIVDNLEYRACASLNSGNLESFSDLSSSNYRVVTTLENVNLSENFVMVDDFNGAAVEIFMLDPQHMDYGKLTLLGGFIDSFDRVDECIFFNIKGILSVLEKTMGETYSPLCRANFCDKKCGLDRTNYTFRGFIDMVTSESTFHSSDEVIRNKTKDYFKYGYLTFTDGENAGKSVEVKQSDEGNITLNFPPENKLKVGDGFNIICGCDKKFDSCCDKFNNALNFRGEPNLPRTAKVYKFY